LIAELTHNYHNIALLTVVPLAFGFWLLSRIPNVWPWSFFLAAVLVIYQPLGCVINDWMIRTVLARFFVFAAFGPVICTGPAAWMSLPFVLALVPISLYFYANPIQE
jgi:hypothetical protein